MKASVLFSVGMEEKVSPTKNTKYGDVLVIIDYPIRSRGIFDVTEFIFCNGGNFL